MLSLIKNKIAKLKIPIIFFEFKHNFWSFFGQKTIIIYTMGKVGSSSLYWMLKNSKLNLRLVYHVHFLTKKNIESMNLKYEKAGIQDTKKVPLANFILGNPNHRVCTNILKTKIPTQQWLILSIIRDPMDTFLSHIFQNPKVSRPFLLNQKGEIDLEKVKKYLFEFQYQFDPDNEFISNWFDDEFKQFTNADVYNYKFDHEKGYIVVDSAKYKILVARIDVLNNQLNGVLSQLLDKKITLNVNRKNERKNTKNADIYSEIKRTTVFDKNFLQNFYSTKFAKHFFTESFRLNKIEYWSKSRN